MEILSRFRLSARITLSYSSQTTVLTQPDWPFEHSYCYAFKRQTKFYCLPCQGPVSATWAIDSAGIETIVKGLTPPRNPDPFASLHDAESPDADTRHDAEMRTGHIKLYAHISSLTFTEKFVESIDWYSTRGWFDECVKASRYYDRCNGHSWSYASCSQSNEGSETDISDSYFEEDFEEWEAQQERDRSLTLATGLEGRGDQLMDVFECLNQIELV